MARNHRGEILRGGTELPEGHIVNTSNAIDAAQAPLRAVSRSASEVMLTDTQLREMIGQALEADDLAYAQELAGQLLIREFVNDTELL
jgi:hypothetical protein